ncbi:hypothetical protein MMC31_007097 [Peltigera leucophlebia]|nr:hypothetical protein [Peltigera leucophlebia]
MISPDKKSRWALHSHEKRYDLLSWSTYFPLFSRKITGEGYTRHLESLRDVWGRERNDQLLELIFGPQNTRSSNSKTRIHALYNMITLSSVAHTNWGLGTFTLEPLRAKSESPKELRIAADPTSIELIPLTTGSRLFNAQTGLPVINDHVVTFTTNDAINAPVPHRDFLMLQFILIRVLRMACMAAEDMLETFDSDDDVSLLAASNAGSTEEQRAHELTRSPPYYSVTTDLETSPPTSSPNLGSGGCYTCEAAGTKKATETFLQYPSAKVFLISAPQNWAEPDK